MLISTRIPFCLKTVAFANTHTHYIHLLSKSRKKFPALLSMSLVRTLIRFPMPSNQKPDEKKRMALATPPAENTEILLTWRAV